MAVLTSSSIANFCVDERLKSFLYGIKLLWIKDSHFYYHFAAPLFTGSIKEWSRPVCLLVSGPSYRNEIYVVEFMLTRDSGGRKLMQSFGCLGWKECHCVRGFSIMQFIAEVLVNSNNATVATQNICCLIPYGDRKGQ